jgi:hypothetical protein
VHPLHGPQQKQLLQTVTQLQQVRLQLWARCRQLKLQQMANRWRQRQREMLLELLHKQQLQKAMQQQALAPQILLPLQMETDCWHLQPRHLNLQPLQQMAKHLQLQLKQQQMATCMTHLLLLQHLLQQHALLLLTLQRKD